MSQIDKTYNSLLRMLDRRGCRQDIPPEEGIVFLTPAYISLVEPYGYFPMVKCSGAKEEYFDAALNTFKLKNPEFAFDLYRKMEAYAGSAAYTLPLIKTALDQHLSISITVDRAKHVRMTAFVTDLSLDPDHLNEVLAMIYLVQHYLWDVFSLDTKLLSIYGGFASVHENDIDYLIEESNRDIRSNDRKLKLGKVTKPKISIKPAFIEEPIKK